MKRFRALLIVLAITVVLLPVAWVLLQSAGGPTEPADMSSGIGAGTGLSSEAAPPSDTERVNGAAPAEMAAIELSDPDSFAHAVAEVLFTMDARVLDADDYRRLLMSHADPLMSDSGIADLQQMVGQRIPDETQWSRMRANRQWSQWSPTAVWEPETWTAVVTDGSAEPGWAMRNVTGTQTTHYVDAHQPRTALSEPTVTIGMRCPAPGSGVDHCHLTMIGTVVVP